MGELGRSTSKIMVLPEMAPCEGILPGGNPITWQQRKQFERRGAFGTALPLRPRRKTLNRSDDRRMSAKIRGNHHRHETAYCRTRSGTDPHSSDICCS